MAVLNQWSGDKALDTFVLKAGDRMPVLGLTLKYYDGTVRDLTGVTSVKLRVAPVVGGRRLIDDATMTVVGSAANGYVQYAWKANELVAGEYLMEILVDSDDAGVLGVQHLTETFPRGGYYKLTIVPHL